MPDQDDQKPVIPDSVPVFEVPLHQRSLRYQIRVLTEKHGFATILDTLHGIFRDEHPQAFTGLEFERLIEALEKEGL